MTRKLYLRKRNYAHARYSDMSDSFESDEGDRGTKVTTATISAAPYHPYPASNLYLLPILSLDLILEQTQQHLCVVKA